VIGGEWIDLERRQAREFPDYKNVTYNRGIFQMKNFDQELEEMIG
jgi:hypothetical protein